MSLSKNIAGIASENMSYLDRPKLRLIQGAALLAIFLALGFGFLWNSDSQALALIQRNLKKADALVQSQNLPEAQSTFKEMLANVPMVYFAYQSRLELLDQARIDLAQLQIRQNQLTAARKSLEQVVSKTHQSQAEKIRNELDDGVKLKEADQLVATGHWYEAEKLYDRHLNLTKQSLQHRMLFHTVLIRQGRTVKARQTYADGVFALDHPEDGLASLWVMDVEEPVIGDWTASIEQAARLTPDDPRVRLAQAFLDRSAGRFQDARTLIDRLIAQRPDDRAVLQERLQLAMAEGDFSKALEISKQLKFTKAEANRIAAWLFQKADFISNEAECLKIVVQINPSDRPALSRLSEIAASQKLAKQAAEYQALKREAELRRIEYSKLCRKSSPLTPEIGNKLADTAARLGFVMDSWAWKTLAAGKALAYSEQPQEEFKLLMDWVELESLKPSVDKSAIALQPNLVDRNPIEFEDIAQGSGLAAFVHQNGGLSTKLIPPLSTGGGVGLIDYDNDGFMDVYAVQSGSFPPDPGKPHNGDRLFRNLGDGRFLDMTAQAGLDKFPRGFGHGVAIGDIDNDGFSDIFVTRWRSYALYRNKGNGTFEDVTKRYGLSGDRDWPTSAAFADLDNDGDLDLYVCHYMEWIEGKSYPCIDPLKPNTYDCRPIDFPALTDHLFRNDGSVFTDISKESGVEGADLAGQGRGLGVVSADVNQDGLMDLFVANDTTANFLFLNRGKMIFEESAFASGVAANAQGGYQAGMGTAAADMDGDGLIDLAVTNFYNESTSIFLNLGNGLFADRTAAFGVAAASRFYLGFGIALTDFDNDSRTDLLTVNGHVTDGRPTIPWRMPMQLMKGQLLLNPEKERAKMQSDFLVRSNRLVDVSAQAGSIFQSELMGRGLAVGDLDNDGRIDAVIQSQNDPLLHLRNTTKSKLHWVTLKLMGVKSNRDGVGSKLTVHFGEHRKTVWRVGGGSFQSASDGHLHVGLGGESEIKMIEVQWPSGMVDQHNNIKADRRIEIKEGGGMK